MLAEFVNRISTLANETLRVEAKTFEWDRRHAYLISPSGEIVKEPIMPDIINDAVGSLDSFIAIVSEWTDPITFIQAGCIHASKDRSFREDQVKFIPTYCPRWKKLVSLRGHWMSQQEAVDTVRHGLWQHESSLATLLQHIQFNRASATSTTVGHTKQSLGRKVEAEVGESSKIPPVVTVRMPIFTDHRLQYEMEVEVALDFDATTEKVRLTVDERGVLMAYCRIEQLLCRELSEILPGIVVVGGIN